MFTSQNLQLISRIVVALLVFAFWALVYLDGRWAYEMPRGIKRYVLQFSTVVGAVAVFSLQFYLLERFAPEDAYGAHFAFLVFVEWGGGLVILFTTLLIWRKRTATKQEISQTSHR